MPRTIEEYVTGKLPYLVDNYQKNSDIASELLNGIERNYNLGLDKTRALAILDKYINEYRRDRKNINNIVTGLVNDISKKETTNNNSSNVSSKNPSITTSNSSKTSSGNTSRNINVDVDTVEKTVKEYANVQEEKDSNNIEAEGYVDDVFSQYELEITIVEEEIDELISDIGNETLRTLEQMDVIDNESAKVIMQDNISFSELVSVCSMYKNTGSKIQLANADTFQKMGYDVKDGIVSITAKDGTKYDYNTSTYQLSDSKGNRLPVRYYFPSTISNVSSLTTITCLSGQGEGSMYETTGNNSFYMDSIKSNSILVVPKKINKNDIDLSKVSFSYMSDEVIASTKFITTATKQNSGVSNTIIGCSSGGGSSLKIAARAGDLYDNVISINYAPIFQGDNKGVNKGDDNRLTIEEANNLNNKNLVFISTKGDKNVENGRDSVVYKGMSRLLDYCPNADITMITNSNSSAFSSFNNHNYHYFGMNSEYWASNMGNYDGHGDYHKVYRDVINSGILS